MIAALPCRGAFRLDTMLRWKEFDGGEDPETAAVVLKMIGEQPPGYWLNAAWQRASLFCATSAERWLCDCLLGKRGGHAIGLENALPLLEA